MDETLCPPLPPDVDPVLAEVHSPDTVKGFAAYYLPDPQAVTEKHHQIVVSEPAGLCQLKHSPCLFDCKPDFPTGDPHYGTLSGRVRADIRSFVKWGYCEI